MRTMVHRTRLRADSSDSRMVGAPENSRRKTILRVCLDCVQRPCGASTLRSPRLGLVCADTTRPGARDRRGAPLGTGNFATELPTRCCLCFAFAKLRTDK